MKRDNIIINKNRKIRNEKLIVPIIAIFTFVGALLFGKTGGIVFFFLGILCNWTIGAIKGVQVWKKAEVDYSYLLTSGFSEEEALFNISKSFNNKLSDAFHVSVVEKFNTLDGVVNFFTGALPEGELDEKYAKEVLDKTNIVLNPSGTYSVKTSFKN